MKPDRSAPRWALSPRRWGLGLRLSLGVFALLTLVLLVTQSVYRGVFEERREAEVANAETIARALSDAIGVFARDVEHTVLSMTLGLGARPSLSQAEDGPYLQTVFQRYDLLRSLFLTDTSGQIIASYSGRDIGRDLSSRPYIQALRAGRESVWSPALRGVVTGEITVAHARVVRSPSGDARGFLVAAFYPRMVLERLPFTTPRDARITLLDATGGLLYTSDPASTRGRTSFGQTPDVRRALGGEIVLLQARRGLLTGGLRYGAIVPIPGVHWVISFTRPLLALEARLRGEFIRQMVGVGLLLLLAGLVLVLMVNRLTHPLRQLARVSSAIARGERPVVPPLGGPPELSELAEGMAAMGRAISEREDALARRVEMQRFLAEAGGLLGASLEDETILRRVARLAAPRIADWCLVHTLQESGVVRRVEIAHGDPAVEARLKPILSGYPSDVTSPTGPVARALESGQTLIVDPITDEWLRTVVPESMLGFVQDLNLRSVLVAPMVARRRTLGTITLVRQGTRPSFLPDEVALLEDLARRAGVALDNARIYERERTVARTLQDALLPPDLPRIPGVALSAHYRPAAGGVQIGGDWYDAFWVRDGRLGLSIGDVAGHGLEAAVAMGQIRQGIRVAAWEGIPPSAVLAHVNRLLAVGGPTEMATALYGILDTTTGTFTFANAGHPAPIVTLPGGGVEAGEGAALPLGLQREADLEDRTLHVPAGAWLVLYTDGLIEYDRHPLEGERILRQAVLTALDQAPANPARAIVDGVLGDRTTPDDVALLIVSRMQVPSRRFDLALPAIPSAVPLIRQSVRQLTHSLDLSPERRVALEIAVGEAINNVVEHAYAVVPGEVRVRGAVEEDDLVISVEDDGQWRLLPTGEGGRGMAIMRSLVDQVEITQGAAGTIARLMVHLGRQASEGRETAMESGAG